jgi:hypothetical protein
METKCVLTPVTEFEISRKVWLRGEGGVKSWLRRRDDGKMCCVGIYVKAMGASDDDITDIKSVNGLIDAGVDVPYWMDGRGFDHIGGLYRNNDNQALSPDERERLITEGFAANSIKVTFID